MKFVTFYVLTFLIVSEVAGGGEFTQEDLHYIAERLSPLECSKLLKDLPGSRKNEEKNSSEDKKSSDYYESDTSRKECFESLYECNESRKESECTKKWFIAALYKFGRADLAAGLKKRWKKLEMERDKWKKRRRAKKTKLPRTGRKSDMKRNNGNDTAKNIVKSENHRISDTSKLNPKLENIFDESFVIFVAAGSFLILGFLATVLFVAYRRACRCFKNYEEYRSQNGKKPVLHKPLEEDLNNYTSKIPQPRNESDQVGSYTKFVFESDKVESEDQGMTENILDPSIGEHKKMEYFESVREPEATKKCRKPGEKKSKRKISPCARIKRFIDSQKRILRGEKEKEAKKRKRKSCHENKCRARDQVGKRNVKTNPSPRNREKKGKIVRTKRKKIHQSETTGCTCHMCRLFDVKDHDMYNEGVKNLRDLKN